MMSSAIWILACPLGMFAMGGVVWVATRLPGKRAERLARTASRASCMSMGAKQQPSEAEETTPAASSEPEIPAHV
jgi:hypothetical protein